MIDGRVNQSGDFLQQTRSRDERCVFCVCCYSCRYATCMRAHFYSFGIIWVCVDIEINRVQRHIAIPFYSSSHSSPGFLFVFLRRICGESNQSIHGIYHYSVCDPSLNHRKAYGLDVTEIYLPGSLYSYFWCSFVDVGDIIGFTKALFSRRSFRRAMSMSASKARLLKLIQYLDSLPLLPSFSINDLRGLKSLSCQKILLSKGKVA